MNRSRMLVVAVALTAAAVATALAMASPGPSRAQLVDAPAAPVPMTAQASAARVLGEWDRRRSRAWGSGSVSALHRLYVDGSGAGAHDAAMLRSWAARGLTVRGMQTQLLRVRVIRESGQRLVLAVTDRVASGVVTGHGRRTPLPADAPGRELVTMVKPGAGRWLVQSVQKQRSQISKAAACRRCLTSER
jgi:hypothetical protein